MLQKCCFCVSIPKATLILAYVGLMWCSICLMTGIIAFININDYILNTYKTTSEDAFLYYKTGKFQGNLHIIFYNFVIYFLALTIFLFIFTSSSFLNLICNIFLIVGTLKVSF
jgi:hypothetical protein